MMTTSRPARCAAAATARRRATFEAKVVTATRCGASAMRRSSTTATSPSLGLTPSRMALVESETSASTPSWPSAARRSSSVGEAEARRRVELPVAAYGGPCRAACGWRARSDSGMECETGMYSTSNGPTVTRSPLAHDGDRDFRRVRLAGALGLEQGRRERRHVDRHLELRPEIDQRAEMVLVRMGDDDAGELGPCAPAGSGCRGGPRRRRADPRGRRRRPCRRRAMRRLRP